MTIFCVILFTLAMSTDVAAQIEVKSNGRVGVGTASPAYKTDVNGTLRATEFRGKGSSNTIRLRTPSGYMDAGPANSSWSHFFTDRPMFWFSKEVRVNGHLRPYSSNNFYLGASSLYYKETWSAIYKDGNSSSYYCDPSSVSRFNYSLPRADNTGYCGTSASTWNYGYFRSLYRQYEYSLSDARTKENIRNISGALALIMQLDGKLYDFKADPTETATAATTASATTDDAQFIASGVEGEVALTSNNDENILAADQAEIDRTQAQKEDRRRFDNYGFLAQDVQKVIPAVVDYNETEDLYALSYTQLVPILVEAMKEQQKQIDAQQQQIEALIQKLEQK